MDDEEKKYLIDVLNKALAHNGIRIVNNLEKEIAELKAQNESLKNTLQAIATDTNEHIIHNVAQNELDKWEKAE